MFCASFVEGLDLRLNNFYVVVFESSSNLAHYHWDVFGKADEDRGKTMVELVAEANLLPT